MKLCDVKLGLTKERYVHKSGKIGTILNSYIDDGASLIFESLDDSGDIMSGDIFMCEASSISICTENEWNEKDYDLVCKDGIKFMEA